MEGDIKPKKSKLALVSFVLGVLYVLMLVYYFYIDQAGAVDTTDVIGAGIAAAMVTPHLVVTAVAVIFNGLGYFLNNRNFVLVGAILYAVAMVLFFIYFMFVIIQMILSFVAFSKMPKKVEA